MVDKEFERTNLGNGFTVDGNNNYYHNGEVLTDDESLKNALIQQKTYLEMQSQGLYPVGDTGYYYDVNENGNNYYEKDGSSVFSDLGQAKISEIADDYYKKQKEAYESIASLSFTTKLTSGISKEKLEAMRNWLPSELEQFKFSNKKIR